VFRARALCFFGVSTHAFSFGSAKMLQQDEVTELETATQRQSLRRVLLSLMGKRCCSLGEGRREIPSFTGLRRAYLARGPVAAAARAATPAASSCWWGSCWNRPVSEIVSLRVVTEQLRPMGMTAAGAVAEPIG
jgi:hypothetical protein